MIKLEVLNTDGLSKIYEFEIDTKVSEIIRHIVQTHPSFVDDPFFSYKTVNYNQTKLVHDGKTLSPQKRLEEFTRFQIKAPGAFRVHIIVKGGRTKSSSSPISIHGRSHSGINYGFTPPDLSARSYPGSDYITEQLNRSKGERQVRHDQDRAQTSEAIVKLAETLSATSKFANILSKQVESENQLIKIERQIEDINRKLDLLFNHFNIDFNEGVENTF